VAGGGGVEAGGEAERQETVDGKAEGRGHG
jgi:hypothetical protein